MDARDRCGFHAHGNRAHSEEPPRGSRQIARARFQLQVPELAGCRTRSMPAVVRRRRPGWTRAGVRASLQRGTWTFLLEQLFLVLRPVAQALTVRSAASRTLGSRRIQVALEADTVGSIRIRWDAKLPGSAGRRVPKPRVLVGRRPGHSRSPARCRSCAAHRRSSLTARDSHRSETRRTSTRRAEPLSYQPTRMREILQGRGSDD